MRTLEEWFNDLDEPFRSKAFKNNERPLYYTYSSLECALWSAFVWNKTPEGHYYWKSLVDQL